MCGGPDNMDCCGWGDECKRPEFPFPKFSAERGEIDYRSCTAHLYPSTLFGAVWDDDSYPSPGLRCTKPLNHEHDSDDHIHEHSFNHEKNWHETRRLIVDGVIRWVTIEERAEIVWPATRKSVQW